MVIPNVISNPKRPHKVERMQREMVRQGIVDYKVWPSIHIADKPVRTAISKAHKQIVEWAANEEIKEVCIFEEDVFFPAEDGWQYFLNNKPENYDLYLGGVSRGTIENGVTRRYSGQFCYFIHERYYDTFLRTDEKMDIDGAQSGRGKFYVCEPFAAFCYPGWSDNVKGVMDYSHLLVGRTVYGFGLVNNKEDTKRFSMLANTIAALPASS